jgi:hypothetical protein
LEREGLLGSREGRRCPPEAGRFGDEYVDIDFGSNLTPWPPLLRGEGEALTIIYPILLPFSF